MPRGVYERKPKSPTATTAKVETKKRPYTRKAAKAVSTQQLSPTLAETLPSSGPHDLYVHLRNLTDARTSLSGGAAHNPQVLAVIDAELTSTVGGLRNWRESRYPTAKAEVAKEVAPVATKIAQPAPQAVQAVPQTPPAPLPFTPAAVQDVMKQTQ